MKQFVFICFLFASFLVKAQPPSKFYSTYGGNGYDVGYSVKQTLDKGYIIAGSTSSFGQGNTDFYLLKLDSMGQKKFETSFGGYSNEIAKSVVQLLDSSYIILGYTSSFGIGGYDVFLVKADKNGVFEWQKTIGGNDWDFAYSIEQTLDGGFIIGGTTYSFGYGNADGYVIKTDVLGNVIWSKTYGGKRDDEFKSVIQTADGNYALTGYTKSYNDSLGDAWLFKIDVNGDSIWSKYYGGNKEDLGNCVIQDISSNLLVSGGTKSNSVGGNSETFIATYNVTNGTLGYNYVDPSTQIEYYNSVSQGLNGNIANCGVTNNAFFGYDAVVDIYWNFYIYLNFFSKGTTKYEEFYCISKTKDKGFVAVGKTNGYDVALDDVFFMKMDSIGNYGNSIIGIQEYVISKKWFSVYPNPASEELNFKIENTNLFQDEISVKIIDLTGKLVLEQPIKQSSTKLNIQGIQSGLYFIELYRNQNLIDLSKVSILNQ